MSVYTMYWPEWACDDARSLELEGKKIPVFFGGHNADSDFNRFKVGPGDTVIAITCIDGDLYLLASLIVLSKTSADGWLARHPDDVRFRFSRGGGQALGGQPVAALSFARRVPSSALTSFRYDSGKDGRALKFLEKGKLKRPSSMVGVYRLQVPTAQTLLALLESAPAASRKTSPNVTELREALILNPADRDAARVLADAWQDLGDPRGELLALEVAIAEARPERAVELSEALERAMSKRGMAKSLKLPGGFPYRSSFLHRPSVLWQLTGALERPLSFAEMEESLRSVARLHNPRLQSPERVLSMDEARAHRWARPAEDMVADVEVLFPGTQTPLPFQSRRFFTDGSEVRMGGRLRFSIRCRIPRAEADHVAMDIIARLKAALPAVVVRESGHESATLLWWQGRSMQRTDVLEP